MAWNFTDGFDLYTAAADAINGYWDSGPDIGVPTLVAGRFSGSRALSANGSIDSYLIKSSGINDAVHHIAVAFQQTATTGTAGLGLFLLLLDGSTAQCCVVFNRNGDISLHSGSAAGAVLATYAGAHPIANTWYQFEFEIVVNNTTGSFKVRKNGNPTEDFSLGSLNTRGGTGNNYANKLTVGMQAAVSSQMIDDLFWRSDASSVAWLGDIRCHARMPASDASVAFSRTPTGVLTQTVPTTAATATVTGSNNIAFYTAFTAVYSGTITGVGVAVNAVGNAVNMKCAIHADNGLGTGPGAVLASATAPFTPVVVGTNSFTFSPGVTIVKGVQYWIGADTDGTASMKYTAGTAAAQGASCSMAYASFPQASPVVTTPFLMVQMSWTYTATPANWQAVNEAQQDAATSYVYSSTAGQEDFYGVASIASTPSTVIATTVRAYAQKSDAGTRTAAAQIKSGSTTAASPTVVLTTSGWQWMWRTDTTNPATSLPWTPAEVNTATIGVKVVA